MHSVIRRRGSTTVLAVAIAALLLCLGTPGVIADSVVSLSELQVERVNGQLYEVSVRVEGESSGQQSIEIGFFYTEQRTRRHNLIGIATVMPIEAGEWLRPGVNWDTSSLNPGLYKLRAIVMDDPGVYAEFWEDEAAGVYEYVIVQQAGAGLVWPSEDVSLQLVEEILCSMDWDKLSGNPTPTATLQSVWNLGGESIDPADPTDLLARGTVTLIDEDGSSASPSEPFEVGGAIIGTEIAPGTSADLRILGFDLHSFVRATLIEYIDETKPYEDQIKLGSPIPVRMAMTFSTPSASEIAGSLQGFTVYLPATTDPQLPAPNVFSLYTDVEDFIFPNRETCSTSADEAVYGSSTIPPVPSLTSGFRWDTYVVGGNAPGKADTIYVLNRFGDYGERPTYSVVERAEDGRRTATPIDIVARPAVGVGVDPNAKTNKPVLFFTAPDGYLRGLLDDGAVFNTAWQPDEWTHNAIRVPSLSGELSPPALAPRPQPDKRTSAQDPTEFVVVGSSEGLYIYQLTFGGAGVPAEYYKYEGYSVRTDLAPFIVSNPNDEWLVYFFAQKQGESAVKLWGANISRKEEPDSAVLFLGGDLPSTEIVGAMRSDGTEDTAILFFGTKNGKVHAVDANYIATGNRLADGPSIGQEILGMRVVASDAADPTTYSIYANAKTNRLHRVVAVGAGAFFQFGGVETYAPRFSNQYLMSAPLEVLPETADSPGLIFLTYEGGPLVVLDLGLEDVARSMRVSVWRPVWKDDQLSQLRIPFEFPGAGFTRPVVARIAEIGTDVRLLIGSAGSDGRVYAFDLSVEIITPPDADEAAEGSEPVSP